MLQPVTLGLQPSFGFGDRTGLATPGHVAALQRAGAGILPIFAQQSIREMARTGRSPQQVMDEAFAGARQAGYTGPIGADADHNRVIAVHHARRGCVFARDSDHGVPVEPGDMAFGESFAEGDAVEAVARRDVEHAPRGRITSMFGH